MILEHHGLIGVRQSATIRAATPRTPVVAPEKVTPRRGPQHLGHLQSIFGNKLQRVSRVDTAIAFLHALALFVHAKERRVLRKQVAREQLSHGVKLVFDLEAESAALVEEFLSLLRLDEFRHKLR